MSVSTPAEKYHFFCQIRLVSRATEAAKVSVRALKASCVAVSNVAPSVSVRSRCRQFSRRSSTPSSCSRSAPTARIGDGAVRRQQVAVLPARLRPDALRGRIAERRRDGAERRGLGADDDVDRLAAARRGAGGDRRQGDAADEPGGDQRPAQVVELRRVVRLPGPEARQPLELARRHDRAAGRADPAEHARRAGIDLLRQRRRARGVVDDDLGRLDRGEGVAVGGEVELQPVLPRLHRRCDERVAGLDPQPRRNDRRRPAGRHDDVDRGDVVERARIDRERHRRRRPRRDRHRRVPAVIALGAQQHVDQVAVLGDAAVDLGEVGRRAAALEQRRGGAERLVEAEVVEAGDVDRIADVAGRGRHRRIAGRGGVGPGDRQPRARIERRQRRLRGRRMAHSGGEDEAGADGTRLHARDLSPAAAPAPSAAARPATPHGLCRARFAAMTRAMQIGGGFILVITLLAGAGIGVHYGQGSAGIVIGLVVGLIGAGLVAWRDSRRRR